VRERHSVGKSRGCGVPDLIEVHALEIDVHAVPR
jgi:hypothetical protein